MGGMTALDHVSTFPIYRANLAGMLKYLQRPARRGPSSFRPCSATSQTAAQAEGIHHVQ